MKKVKKLISSLLVAAMLLTAAPLSGFVGLKFPIPDLLSGLKAFAVSSQTSGNYTYSVDSDGNATITDVSTEISGKVEVPETIDDHKVIAIGNYAFQDCSGITEIIVPDSVESIGVGAFKGLNQLANITLPFVGNKRTSTGYSGVFGYIFGYYNSTSNTSSEDAVYQYYYPNSSWCYYFYFVPKTIKSIDRKSVV